MNSVQKSSTLQNKKERLGSRPLASVVLLACFVFLFYLRNWTREWRVLNDATGFYQEELSSQFGLEEEHTADYRENSGAFIHVGKTGTQCTFVL